MVSIIISKNEPAYDKNYQPAEIQLGYGKNLPEGTYGLEAKEKEKLNWDGKYKGVVNTDNMYKFVKSYARMIQGENRDGAIGIVCPEYLAPSMADMLAANLKKAKGLEDVGVFIQNGPDLTPVETKEFTPTLKDSKYLLDIALDKGYDEKKKEYGLSKGGFFEASRILKDGLVEITKEQAEKCKESGITCLTYKAYAGPEQLSREEYANRVKAGEKIVPFKDPKKNFAVVPGMYLNPEARRDVFVAIKSEYLKEMRGKDKDGNTSYWNANMKIRMIADLMKSDSGILAYAGLPSCDKDFGKHDSYVMTTEEGKKKSVSEKEFEKLSDADKKKCVKKDAKVVYTFDFLYPAPEPPKSKENKESKAQGNALDKAAANGSAPKEPKKSHNESMEQGMEGL
jgi:hypothetical protein